METTDNPPKDTKKYQDEALKQNEKNKEKDGLKQGRLAPYIVPTNDTQKNTFSTIKQGTATNSLTKIRPNAENTTRNPITGVTIIKKNKLTINIPNYEELKGIKTSTYQLLDILTIVLIESGAKSPTVNISLSDYMNKRGLKNRKETKNQIKADLEVLRQMSIMEEGTTSRLYSFINIADSGEIKRNGDIIFTFGSTFYNMILKYTIMPYPNQLQTINNKRNPNSYYLLRKISEHKNMNIGKKNEDIIAVKTLLDTAPFIPSYDKVMAENKNITDRIIAPFERDMNVLISTLEWYYCHSNGVKLTDIEIQNFNYDLFKKLLIKIEWKNYPDQTARIERKLKKLKQTKKKKEE